MKHCCAILFLLGMLTTIEAQGTAPPSVSTKHHRTASIQFSQALNTIAFGSCNDQNKDQSIWKAV